MAQGSEFRVNTYTTSTQRNSAVAMDAVGDFVITWHSSGQDGFSYGIYAQRYALANYNTPFKPPVFSGQTYNPTPVPEGPAGTFSFTARFCNTSSTYPMYPLTGLASQTVILTNGNCLVNRNYGPLGAPALNPGAPPCGAGSALSFPANNSPPNDGYNDYALAVGECVTVPYQIGLQQRKSFSFYADVEGM